ncbi:hypothetical protein QE152_g7651 [Popillia japonica]|uniref:Uncharacterized protein n=1 Tax=Popillia japonica TaxID=7064 RepID=A0AAW1MEY5_POPJA
MVAKETINDETEDIQATNEDDNLQILQIFCLRFQDFQITNILPSGYQISGFSDCDQAHVKAWLESDNDPGYQIMDDSDILNHVQKSQDFMQYDNEDEELEGMKNKNKDVQGN